MHEDIIEVSIRNEEQWLPGGRERGGASQVNLESSKTSEGIHFRISWVLKHVYILPIKIH